jgi:glycerol-3-phosphate dehydrogenase (NAD(P)+)
MGTALCAPLLDRGHQVRLVGTHLDVAAIEALRRDGIHPGLGYPLPAGATYHQLDELAGAMAGAERVAIGVSSAGIEWAAAAIGPLLPPGVPLAFITKGLEWMGERLLTEPEVFLAGVPERVRSTLRPVAVTGPCIAGELIRRNDTWVTFTSRDAEAARGWAEAARTAYYHVRTSDDFTGCEATAALKNAFSIGWGIAAGLAERRGDAATAPAPGSFGVATHNQEAATFAEAIVEMARLVELTGGRAETVFGLVGVGDLLVTTHARNARLGRLLGSGLSLDQAVKRMEGATLEGLATIRTIGRALAAWDAGGRTGAADFPLMRHLLEVTAGERAAIPFEAFFGGRG